MELKTSTFEARCSEVYMRLAVAVQVCSVLQLCLLQPTLPADFSVCVAPEQLRPRGPTRSLGDVGFAPAVRLLGGGGIERAPARCKAHTTPVYWLSSLGRKCSICDYL